MSDLRFSIEFRNRSSGARHTVVVDLGEFTVRELEQAWCGPGGLFGPVAWAHAYRHAARRTSPDYIGLPASVKAHRLQDA